MLAVIMAIENEDDRLFVETVFNRYAKKRYLVAYNILGNRADAEDCVQDTFVKIIDKLDRFKNAQKDDSLIKLLVIVCRNTALDMYDKNKRIAETQCSQTVCDGGGSSVMDIPDSSADVERLVINNCVCEYVVKLIDGLDHKYRDVITLKSMGFDYDEIANIMGISQTLARKRYSRARAMILETGGEMLYEYRSG